MCVWRLSAIAPKALASVWNIKYDTDEEQSALMHHTHTDAWVQLYIHNVTLSATTEDNNSNLLLGFIYEESKFFPYKMTEVIQ